MTAKPARSQPAPKPFAGVARRWSSFPADNSPTTWMARSKNAFASRDLLTIPGFQSAASALYTAERRRSGTRFEGSQPFFARMRRSQLHASPPSTVHPFASQSGREEDPTRTSEERVCAHVSPQRGYEALVGSVFEGMHNLEPYEGKQHSTHRSKAPSSSALRGCELNDKSFPVRHKHPSRHSLGKISRMLLQVDSVSVRSSSATMQDANALERLLRRLNAYKSRQSTVPRSYDVPGGRNSPKRPVFARSSRSLRLLLIIGLLLAAFVLASGFFAGKNIDTASRCQKKVDMKHRECQQYAVDNFTVEHVVVLHQPTSAQNESGTHIQRVRHPNVSSSADAALIAQPLKGTQEN